MSSWTLPPCLIYAKVNWKNTHYLHPINSCVFSARLKVGILYVRWKKISNFWLMLHGILVYPIYIYSLKNVTKHLEQSTDMTSSRPQTSECTFSSILSTLSEVRTFGVCGHCALEIKESSQIRFTIWSWVLPKLAASRLDIWIFQRILTCNWRSWQSLRDVSKDSRNFIDNFSLLINYKHVW